MSCPERATGHTESSATQHQAFGKSFFFLILNSWRRCKVWTSNQGRHLLSQQVTDLGEVAQPELLVLASQGPTKLLVTGLLLLSVTKQILLCFFTKLLYLSDLHFPQYTCKGNTLEKIPAVAIPTAPPLPSLIWESPTSYRFLRVIPHSIFT